MSKTVMVPTRRDNEGLWPVLLPGHEHSDFGEPGVHWHVDWRYAAGEPQQSKVLWESSSEDCGTRKWVQIRDVYQAKLGSSYLAGYMAQKMCRERGTTMFPQSVRRGVCPHKGLPMYDVGGGVQQCVGHGLCLRACDGSAITEFYHMLIGASDDRYAILQEDAHWAKIFIFSVKVDCWISGLDTVCIGDGGELVQVGHLPFSAGASWVKGGDCMRLTIQGAYKTAERKVA